MQLLLQRALPRAAPAVQPQLIRPPVLALRCKGSPAPASRLGPHLVVCRAAQQQQRQQQLGQQPAPDGIPAAPQAAQPLTAAGLATAAAAAVLLQPGAALAAESAEQAQSMYLLSVGAGTAFTILTLLSTSRFVMSFFPSLEKKARARRMPWAVLTICDPLLRPLQRGLFKMEPGDLNYGAVALLATVTSLLESLVGEYGLWLDKVPDPLMLSYLQHLVFWQNVFLLQTWIMVVCRAFFII